MAPKRSCFLILAVALCVTSGCQSKEEKSLVRRLTDVSHSWVRGKALEDLNKLTDDQKTTLVQPLTLRLQDRDNYVRQNAAVALGQIGSLASAAVPALQKIRADPNENVRRMGRVALARMGYDVNETVRDLIQDMQSHEAETRRNAITGLAMIGEPAKDSAVALGKALHDEDPYIPQFAANALTSLGRNASAAAPELIKGLHSPDRNIRYLCSVALRNVESPEAREALKTFHLD